MNGREDPAAVATAVAAILDSRVEDVPFAVGDCIRARSATRRIIEANLSPADEDRLLRALASWAARAPLPLWTLQAIEVELLGGPSVPRIDHERASALLRLRGYECCPTCSVKLPHELTIEQAERRRSRAERDLAVWRQAAPLAGAGR